MKTTVNGRTWELVEDRGERTVRDADNGGFVMQGPSSSKKRYFASPEKAVEYLELHYR